jgi:hypothetical protein
MDELEAQSGLGPHSAQPATPDGDKTQNPYDPVPFRTQVSIVSSNMESMEREKGEDERTWITRVCKR